MFCVFIHQSLLSIAFCVSDPDFSKCVLYKWKVLIFSVHFSNDTYCKSSQLSNCLWQVIRDNKAKQEPFPTKIWYRTRCCMIAECSLTEINLRRANGQSPPLESALIDWHSVLSGTEQSWNNYSNLRVEWWSSIWSGAEVSGALHWSACHDKEKARHGLEKCMMGCQCSTGIEDIDWQDWQWLKCLLL